MIYQVIVKEGGKEKVYDEFFSELDAYGELERIWGMFQEVFVRVCYE